MKSIRLLSIEQDVDFRSSELTIYEAFRKKSKRYRGDPKPDQAYMFVSCSGNQIVWITSYEEKAEVLGRERRRIQSTRFRLSGGHWDPMMMANYAESVGLKLIGIKRFEEIYKNRGRK